MGGREGKEGIGGRKGRKRRVGGGEGKEKKGRRKGGEGKEGKLGGKERRSGGKGRKGRDRGKEGDWWVGGEKVRVRVEVACALGAKIKREIEEFVGRGYCGVWVYTREERKSLKVK